MSMVENKVTDQELDSRQHTSRKPLPLASKVIALSLLLGAFIVILYGIHTRSLAESSLGDRTEHAAVPVVSVVMPAPPPKQSEVVLPGNTQAYYDTPIFARTNGYLKHWYFDIGAHVKEGQLLAEIETPETDRQLEQARADLENAKANEQLSEITAARWQNLLKSDSVSKQETDQAVSDLSARKATVASMTANVHRLEQLQSFEKIYAPFTGVITARNTDVGALIDAGSASNPKELFHMASVSRLRVYVAVPEADIRVAETSSNVKLTLDEYPGETFSGTIVRDSDSIDATSRTLRVEVDVDNPKDRIKTGAYVLVHFAVPQSGSFAQPGNLTVPANTLLFRSEGLRVAVVRQGHVELVPVRIGRDYGSTVEVVSGLQAQDQVVVNPSDSLSSGTPVSIAPSTAEATKR